MLHFFAIVSFSSLQSSCYKLYVYFRNFSYITITQKSSVERNEKLVVKNVQHKPEEAFSDGTRGDIQLGRFILLSVAISYQLPRHTSPYFFSFLNWPLKHDCVFRWETFEWFWTFNHSWKLEIFLLQATSYRAPFMQFSP